MSQSIRWSYVGPRLLALTIVWLLVLYGLPPLLRWSMIRTGEATVGAKVEIGNITTSLSDAQIIVRDVAVANPHKPLRNLVAADRVELNVDVASLLRKKYVVESGSIRGLRFDTPRATSGALDKPDEETEPSVWSEWANRAAAAGAEGVTGWLGNATATIERDLRQEFQSPALVEDLATRWPDKYKQLERDVRSLRDRGKQLEGELRAARKNSLRGVQAIPEILRQIGSLQQDAAVLAKAIERLGPQLEADRQAVDVARTQDLAKVRQHIELGHLEPEAISEYLLSREVAGQVGTAVEWLRFARRLSGRKRQKPDRGRGWDILFAGLPKRADFLIRSLAIQGSGRIGGEQFDIVGTAIGITPQPKRYGRPTIVKLATTGAAQVHAEASFDRTGDEPVDRLTLVCPATPLPAHSLGDASMMTLVVGPSTASVEVELAVVGDAVDGMLHLASRDVDLTPQVAAKLGGETTTGVLQTALAGVDHIGATVHLDGTLDQPAWKIESNLGTVIARGMQDAWKHEILRRRDELVAKLHHRLDAKMGELKQSLDARRDELLRHLQADQAQLAAVVRGAARRAGLPGGSLGKGLNRLLPR